MVCPSTVHMFIRVSVEISVTMIPSWVVKISISNRIDFDICNRIDIEVVKITRFEIKFSDFNHDVM